MWPASGAGACWRPRKETAYWSGPRRPRDPYELPPLPAARPPAVGSTSAAGHRDDPQLSTGEHPFLARPGAVEHARYMVRRSTAPLALARLLAGTVAALLCLTACTSSAVSS